MSTLVVYFAGLFGGVLLLTGLAPWWIIVPGALALVWLELRLFSAAHASDGDQKSEDLHHAPRSVDVLPPPVSPQVGADLR